MASPMDVGSFGDLLDKRVTKIFYDELNQLPDRIANSRPTEQPRGAPSGRRRKAASSMAAALVAGPAAVVE